MNCEPICDYKPSHKTFYSIQTKGVWYNNPAVAKYYPIIHLDDIEIHCILVLSHLNVSMHYKTFVHTLYCLKRE